MGTKGTKERYYSTKNTWHQTSFSLHKPEKRLHCLVLDTLKRTGERERGRDITPNFPPLPILRSRKRGPKMAIPACAMAGGNTATRKLS